MTFNFSDLFDFGLIEDKINCRIYLGCFDLTFVRVPIFVIYNFVIGLPILFLIKIASSVDFQLNFEIVLIVYMYFILSVNLLPQLLHLGVHFELVSANLWFLLNDMK